MPLWNTTVEIYENGQIAPQYQGQSNDVRFAARASDLIKSHAKTYGNTQPFFLYLALNSPHSPIEAEQRFLNLYKDPAITSYPLYHTYLAMISSVDESVKKVVNALKYHNLWDNTLFVFSTDNGTLKV